MSQDSTDEYEEAPTEEIKQEFIEAIPDADAVICVAMTAEEDGIDVTSGRALVSKEELSDEEIITMTNVANDELQEQMFGPAQTMGGRDATPLALDKETAEELGIVDEIETLMEEMVENDSNPEGMFQ